MLCLENFNIFLKDVYSVSETVKNEEIGEVAFECFRMPFFLISMPCSL